MRNVRLDLCYDGTRYKGWQRLPGTENTIQANSRFFSDDEIMPTCALTMGIGTIFSAKKILLLINGKNKREAFAQLFTDKITTSCPATLLKLHPNVTVLCDSEAYGE